MTDRISNNTRVTKKRNYSERWYRWRKHLNDVKKANPSLEFWEVLILASDTYDKINHRPLRS